MTRRLASLIVALGFALVGVLYTMQWIGNPLSPISPGWAGSRLLLVPVGIAFAVLGAWSALRQPRATLFALVVGLVTVAWTLPVFPALCIGLLLAPVLRSSRAAPEPGPVVAAAPGPLYQSTHACPVCGERRLRAVTPPRIDVQGVVPWLDLYAMGDPRPDTPPAIACDACGAGWPDLAAFRAATRSAARIGPIP